MSDQTIGVIPGVCNLEFNIKFSEPSEISFDIPSVIDGEPNWLYDRVSGHKIVYTEHYGIYMTMNPETEADGISEIKHVKGYSIEKELDTKKFFLEEGTFKFYDQTNADNGDTIIGRILEIARGWSVGYVSASLAQRYRTFDQYDNYLLSFIYDDAPEKFRCVFVFDPYEKTISAYDADETVDTLPIYLDFDNLVEELGIEEVSDELVTAIRPYGADELDIRDVNPIGTNWIYDLSHFISNGDIPSELASKWNTWQETVLTNQEYYRGLTALRASATANLLAAQAALTDLNGELDTLTAQQSVTIQALAMETTASGIAYQQGLLDEINTKIAEKNQEIAEQESIIASLEDSLDSSSANSYAAQIQAVVDSLAITKFFTDEEYETLCHYFIEQDITESTFVATSVDTSISGASYTLSSEKVTITNSDIVRIDLTSEFGKRMYTLAGGTFSMTGGYSLGCDIIRGTMEEMDGGKFVLSLYAGSITAGNTTVSSGVVTISGTLSNWSDDIHQIVIGTVANEQTGVTDQITEDGGSTLQFTCQSGSLYLTANVSDYQKYSVQMELYDYAVDVLSDLATPTYEFSVDSGNFIFSEEFAPFRNELELGKGVYLNVGNKEVITPYIIEFELDFEDRNKFSIVFSNRFKRHDNCNTLKDMIEQSYSTSRSFDASKYIYNQAANQASAVSQFMSSSLDAAKNTILAAANQSVVINGAGIHVGGDSNYQLRIVDSMIAMTDDNWAHAKLAIGLFASEDVGTYFGVNAEVIGGKLIVGNNLVIENEQVDKSGLPTGVMQFKVDSTGAWLNNATFVLQKDNGGRMILDPAYGLLAGTSMLFDTDGTMVVPSFIDSNGDLVLDKDGMPENSNFYLDIRDGSAYFRGNVYATDGVFNGVVYASGGMFKGTVQAEDFLDSNGNSMLSSSGKILSDYLDIDDAIQREITATVDGISLSVSEPIVGGGQSYVEIALTVNGVTQKGFVKIDGNVDISGQLSADALYAPLGEIAELRVNSLSTSRRIPLYLAHDTSDDNYIIIEDKYIRFMRGITDGSAVQATNPTGALLYWDRDIATADLGTDGYPYVNGARAFTTTDRTDWPVMIYSYVDAPRREVSFNDDDAHTPIDVFGNGYGYEDPNIGRGFVQKCVDSFDMWLLNSANEKHGIFIGDVYTDIVGLRKSTRLDFSAWDQGSFYEMVDGDEKEYEYSVSFDNQGRPVQITDSTGHITAISW